MVAENQTRTLYIRFFEGIVISQFGKRFKQNAQKSEHSFMPFFYPFSVFRIFQNFFLVTISIHENLILVKTYQSVFVLAVFAEIFLHEKSRLFYFKAKLMALITYKFLFKAHKSV